MVAVTLPLGCTVCPCSLLEVASKPWGTPVSLTKKSPRLLGGSIGNGVGLILCIGSGLAAQTAFGGRPLARGLAVGFTL